MNEESDKKISDLRKQEDIQEKERIFSLNIR